MPIPEQPKIYHIVHVDRLSSIVSEGCLWCDREILCRAPSGTTIGMNRIKQRRLEELTLPSHPDLRVGDCVPFYFCPRSVMLYLIHQANHSDLTYRGGQAPIIHLEADLHASVAWANTHQQKWVFTLSNAGAYYFEDRNDLAQLNDLNWQAIQANRWGGNGIDPSIKEGKQAEFLMEYCFPWHLIERIGIYSQNIYQQVVNAFPGGGHRPQVEIKPDWYY
ncbi:DUF4433 domain-containing protein [Leptolyngbya sp. PCC 6406]|uniref:type II toxin-antitoxin system toxin DNA ADP-ribosyl transferase DarT n=1 Tax=Leptolyngbya sp. PCC 6406 TaxID=1173264 RepID=UPI0002ABA385|nr:DUF4433 domain-containing protein [Leptolyngbya sp. PCC 6406]